LVLRQPPLALSKSPIPRANLFAKLLIYLKLMFR
jgi:hypothetical protein